jgi:hypothetical protein
MKELLGSLPSRPSELVIVHDNAKLENPCWKNLMNDGDTRSRSRDRWRRMASLSTIDSSLPQPQRKRSGLSSKIFPSQQSDEDLMLRRSLSDSDELHQSPPLADEETTMHCPQQQQRRWSTDCGSTTRTRRLLHSSRGERRRRRRTKNLDEQASPDYYPSIPIRVTSPHAPETRKIVLRAAVA